MRWDAPGPGTWTFDRSHFDRPLTGFAVAIGRAPQAEGLVDGFARAGIAIGSVTFAVVNGFNYSRQVTADPAVWQLLEAAASAFFQGRRWEDELRRWETEVRPAMAHRSRALSMVDVEVSSAEDLVDHLDACVDAWGDAAYVHFVQHSLCLLIGDLLIACREWRIPPADVLPLLEGASPASARAAAQVRAIADALRAAGARPRTIEDIRGASPDANDALEAYLAEWGLQVVAGFDFDCRTLGEMPDLIVSSALAALDGPASSVAPGASEVRSRVPEEERERFDELLADARLVYGLRDDDVRYVMWARGLVRRALLEAGARLVATGRLHHRDHVLDLAPAEVRALLVAAAAQPSSGEVSARHDLRVARLDLEPPRFLGDAPAPPPLAGMPPKVRRATAAMGAYMQQRRNSEVSGDGALKGIGIGGAVYRARAIVAANADDAFDRLEPGDVLVTVFTTPSFNGVLTLCGGLVVEDGGLLSHAAVMAREIGLPAVVGVPDATRLIPDGADVEIDSKAGRVTVL